MAEAHRNPGDTTDDLKRRPYRVFISHATADKFMARMVDEMLKAKGIETFRDDRDIDGGDRIGREIREQIGASDELCVIWSTQTLDSEWVKQEIGAAWGLGLRIVALLHVQSHGTLPPSIADCKAYTINDAEAYVREVVKRAGGSS